jgi:hypothetical protein
MAQVTTVGIDLAKNVVCIHGVDTQGNVVVKKRLARRKVLPFVAQLPPCLIGMEASGGAHYWARECIKLGHTVKLMSPQFVKPYVQSQKNDPNDAAGICEAVGRPRMRGVSVKSVTQQDVQALHRIRERQIKARTALLNQIRGLLAEYGIVIPQRASQVRHKLPFVLADAENGLTATAREWLQALAAELQRTFRTSLMIFTNKVRCRVCQGVRGGAGAPRLDSGSRARAQGSAAHESPQNNGTPIAPSDWESVSPFGRETLPHGLSALCGCGIPRPHRLTNTRSSPSIAP